MNKRQVSEAVRCMHRIDCDAVFREQVRQDPDRFFTDEQREMGSLFYREWMENARRSFEHKFREPDFCCDEFTFFLQRTRNRVNLSNRLFRNQQGVFYYPVLFELGDGCSVQCPFCGMDAKHLSRNFLFNAENSLLFEKVVLECMDSIGRITGYGALYAATEPMDNPDYEKFLKKFIDLTGGLPQTTTALADRCPERIRKLMDTLGEEGLRSCGLRFSIRNRQQFSRIMELYTPEELLYVRLLSNNPEGVGKYSNSGKVRRWKRGTEGEKVVLDYSISCIAGFRVNFALKKMYFEEPVTPSDRFPTGVRCYAEETFDADSFGEKLRKMMREQIHTQIADAMELRWNPELQITHQGSSIVLEGDGSGCSLDLKGLPEFGKLAEQMENSGTVRWEEANVRKTSQTYFLLQQLYEKGYISVE